MIPFPPQKISLEGAGRKRKGGNKNGSLMIEQTSSTLMDRIKRVQTLPTLSELNQGVSPFQSPTSGSLVSPIPAFTKVGSRSCVVRGNSFAFSNSTTDTNGSSKVSPTTILNSTICTPISTRSQNKTTNFEDEGGSSTLGKNEVVSCSFNNGSLPLQQVSSPKGNVIKERDFEEGGMSVPSHYGASPGSLFTKTELQETSGEGGENLIKEFVESTLNLSKMSSHHHWLLL